MEIPMEWTGSEAGQVWVQGLSDVLGWGMVIALLFMVPLVVLFSWALRRSRFWCGDAHREVEVEFEERGLPGFRRAAAVKSCSVFGPDCAVTCARRCMDPEVRRQWQSVVPAEMRRGGWGGRPRERGV